MKANFRQLFAYYIDVETKKANATLPPILELVNIWEKRRAAGLAHVPISNGAIDLALGDVIVDSAEECAALLIRHSDKQAADFVYSNIINNSFTPYPKQQNEGGETGVHVFLSTIPEQGHLNRYFCLIEKVPYLDITMIRRFLNRLLNAEYGDNKAFHTYPNPLGQMDQQGNVRRDRCLPRLEFQGVPSNNLAKDVQDGRLNGITLIKTESKGLVGGVPFLKKKEATLKIEVDQGSITSNVWGDIRKAIAAEAATYPVAHVGLQLPGRKKTVSVKLDSQTGSPLSDMYIKSFDVSNIFPPMAHSSQVVVSAFLQRAMPILLQERMV